MTETEIQNKIQTPGTYAVHADPAALHAALNLCRGDYQRRIVMGRERLSGAGVSKWGGRNLKSRRALMERLVAARVAREVRGPHGRRVLVVASF